MIQIEFLREIIEHQRVAIGAKDAGMAREQLLTLPDNKSHALIVSGIRRCGTCAKRSFYSGWDNS